MALLPLAIFSQNSPYNTKDKNVTLEDLQNNEFPSDSTANAFYIFEEGFSRFQDGGDYNLLTDYTAKLKILNEEGYDQATVKIHLSKNDDGRKEKIRDLEAYTFNLKDGSMYSHRLEPSKIYTEEDDEYDVVRFTFPDVSPGSVLVYSYQKESPFPFNFETWWFQEDIPKLFSRFKSKIPGNYNYHISKIGELPLEQKDSKIEKNCFLTSVASTGASCVSTVYEMRDIPAFIEEEYLTSKFNYMARLEYELQELTRLDGYVKKFTRSWEDVDHELQTHKSLGRQLKKTRLVEEILPEEIRSQENNLEKARAIYEFVKNNYNWNGDYRIFEDLNLKDVIRDHSGNVSGINILLHNIYEEQGFKVLPVISATRSRGVPTKLFPVLSDFNYLLLQLTIDGENYLLDATEKYADFGMLPFRSLNFYGRVLDFENGSDWVELTPKNFSGISFREIIKLNPDGTSEGSSEQTLTGYPAIDAREKLDGSDNLDLSIDVATKNEQANPVSSLPFFLKETDKELKIAYVMKNRFQKAGQRIYLNPFSFRFFKENPFKLEHRTYPIDFGYKSVYTYSVEVEIPKNYSLEEIPEQKLIGLPEGAGRIQFMVQDLGENKVSVQCRMMLSKEFYGPGYYPYLKEFFNTIMDIQKQSLLVIKENT